MVPVLFLAGLLFLAGAGASATLALSDSSVEGATPGTNTSSLTPGSTVQSSATIMIIPSGSTTFSEGHTLQLTTGLMAATWKVQVYVDSVPAATIPQTGNVVYVNGYLLSYPTSKDVSVVASVSGTVPEASTATVITLIQATELDNSGQPVPGSQVTVQRQIVPLVGPGVATPSTTTGTKGTPASKTPAPGFLEGCAGVCAGAAIMLFISRR